jgi:hypothetical protein
MNGRFGRAPAMIGVLVALVVVAPLMQAPNVARADEEAVYFPETGFWVDSLFADYWERNGGLMTFGYPITRLFYQDGLHLQYFERAIFEHHENESGLGWTVQLVRLGALNTIERRRDLSDAAFAYRAPDPELDAGGVYFGETGHALSATFLDYWERHGGLQTFGYPLSDEFLEPGLEDGALRPVQYFERARFEWHAEFEETAFEVLLGHLGREALAKRIVPELAVTPQAKTAFNRDAPPLPPLPAGEPTPVGCGFNLAFWGENDVTEANAYYMDAAQASGCDWVRLQFTWRDMQPSAGEPVAPRIWPYRHIVNMAKQRGLKLLVNVNHPPRWALPDDPSVPADPAAFGAFMEELAVLLDGDVAAWQIWNEPNIANETNGVIDPAGFLPLLRAGYLAVKAADPEALVVFPGLAPNSMMLDDVAISNAWYLEALLNINNGEAGNYFDVLGVHAYGAGNHPDTYWPGNLAANPGWTDAPEFYFRHAEQSRKVLVAAGLSEIPIWITEMGWPVGAYQETWGYGAWITPQLQADYIARSFEIMRAEWHWVENAFIWHLNFGEAGGPDNWYTGFSLFTHEREPVLAYETVRELSAEWIAPPP